MTFIRSTRNCVCAFVRRQTSVVDNTVRTLALALVFGGGPGGRPRVARGAEVFCGGAANGQKKAYVTAMSSAQISGAWCSTVGWIAYANIDRILVGRGIRTSDLGVWGELRSILRLCYWYHVM